MKIHFQGLIVHAAVPDPADPDVTRQVAVLMYDPHHASVITINASDFRDADSSPPQGTGVGVVCFGLLGRVITSEGWGTATNKPTSIPEVRKLKSGGGDIDDDVHNRQNTKGKFAAFVELPDGSFSVKDYYVPGVIFANVNFGCLARTTTYEFNPRGDVKFTIEGTGLYAVVAPNAEIYITNTVPEGMVHMGSHYESYRALFDPPAPSIHSPVESNTPCPKGSTPPARSTCTVQQDLAVDCSNTRFP
jgi:hypothetical protein